MSHPIAAFSEPETMSTGHRGGLADRIRFVAGIAITLWGAGAFLADLVHLIPFR